MKLNLGCGKDIKKGWINVDAVKNDDVDIVHNLNQFPYPFDDNSIDYILLEHVLEHLDNVVEVIVPYYKHKNAFTDPTHKHFFTEHSMDYFLDGNTKYADWYSEKKFRLIEFERHNGGFPFWHVKKYFKISLPLPFRITELSWAMEAIK